MGNLKLSIKNFQSIEDAQLEFVPGINILIGQSNSGKTAILRALNAVLTNPSYAKTFIKHNETHAAVSYDYNGNSVTWSKSAKGGTVYNVNGESYSKVGTSDITSFLKNSGFVLDYGDVVNIEGEWDLPFPFDKTPAEMFSIFENVFCVSDSSTILRSFKEDEADLVRKKAELTDSISKYEKKKEVLTELENEINVTKIRKELAAFEEHSAQYFNLADDLKSIERLTVLENLKLDEVNPPEQCSLQEYIECRKDLKQLLNIHERSKFYKSLPDVMQVPETITEYLSCLNDYKVILKAKEADSFEIDKEIEVSDDLISSYLTLRDDLLEIEQAKKADSFEISEECNLDTCLTLPSYIDLRTDFTVVMNCYKKMKSLREKEQELDGKIKLAQERLSKYNVCPLCGQPIKNGEVHAE